MTLHFLQRYNIFKGCPTAVTSTIILRGGADQFLDEAHRSIWDSLCIVKRCIECTKIVSGGGAAEMEVMRALRDLSRGEMGKQQLIIAAFAKAMEIIPRQLADNAGFDTTYVVRPCVCVRMCARGDRPYYEHAGGMQGGCVGED